MICPAENSSLGECRDRAVMLRQGIIYCESGQVDMCVFRSVFHKSDKILKIFEKGESAGGKRGVYCELDGN